MRTNEIIETLRLLPHPEGGWYSETYRSETNVVNADGNKRSVCTAIFYLLKDEEKSHFHRLRSDEIWFFHEGTAIELVVLKNENAETIFIGDDISEGEKPQYVIPAGTWFAASVKGGSGYSLVSCTVSPGFDFDDFEMGQRKKLLEDFPFCKEVIIRFTAVD